MQLKMIAALLMTFAGAAPALADNCNPLKLMGSVDLVPLADSARMLVPVSINSTTKKLLLNTAGGFSSLTPSTVEALNLHVIDSIRFRLIDTAGNASSKYVAADTFQMGQMSAKDLIFMVTPDPIAGENPAYDGVLGGDFMARYDVEIDSSARKLNYFSHDHCEGHVIYWKTDAVAAVPFRMERPLPLVTGETRLRIRAVPDTHIRVPVTLDGRDFLATINTGESRSTMTAKTAKFVFGITEDSPDSVPLGLVDRDPNQRVFGHVFHTLTFDGITVTNPHIAIIPDLVGSKDPANSFTTGDRTRRVDDDLAAEVTVGMDVLKHLHLFVAFSERKLYITPAATADRASPNVAEPVSPVSNTPNP